MRKTILRMLLSTFLLSLTIALPAALPGLEYDQSFDPHLYLAAYADLQAAFGTDGTAALEHWMSYGIHEGRRGSPEFDAQFYLQEYPDLQAAFGADYRAALEHWIDHGIRDGRRGSPEFDARFYLHEYPDLQAALGADYQAALEHWRVYGIREGRRGSPEFDVQFYLHEYPDLQVAFGRDYQAALEHWIVYGIREGRRGSPEFDVQFYVSEYPDLQTAFGADYQAALEHWIIYGAHEGRKGFEATIWNNNGDFELPAIDTRNVGGQCYISAPWNNTSWGVEGYTFSDQGDHTIAWSRFESSGHEGYLYGKEESGEWGLVRYVQGDMWGGSYCGIIPWYIPGPLPTDGKNISLDIDLLRDTNRLLSPSDSWIMFAVNIWLSSPELPVGHDITGHKPLVIDLIFYHQCNWTGCGYGFFEDADAFHYQAFLGETPYREWRSWSIRLSDYIQQALDYHWASGSISQSRDTLEIHQIEFLIELKNAEGAATIDNFVLRY